MFVRVERRMELRPMVKSALPYRVEEYERLATAWVCCDGSNCVGDFKKWIMCRVFLVEDMRLMHNFMEHVANLGSSEKQRRVRKLLALGC